jgi:hypothetical protein
MPKTSNGSRSLGQEELPGFPYRISAIIIAGGNPAEGIKVELRDPKTNAVLDTKETNALGRVYFDRANSDLVRVQPVPGMTKVALPAYRDESPVPMSRWWWNAWDWEGDSLRFQIGGSGKSITDELSEYFTWKNALIGGAILVGVYLVYHWTAGAASED